MNENTRIPNPMPGPALCKALIEAQRHAQGVAKASKNTFHNYSYASAEAIIEEARDALTHAGVVVSTLGWESQDGRIVVRYLVAHESGEAFVGEASTPVLPEKGRPLDKAEATALTANLSYFLRGLLLLPRVDAAEEMNTRDDRPERTSRAAGSRPAGPRVAALPGKEKGLDELTEALAGEGVAKNNGHHPKVEQDGENGASAASPW